MALIRASIHLQLEPVKREVRTLDGLIKVRVARHMEREERFAGIIPLLKSVDSKTARTVRLVSEDCGVMTQFRLTPFFLTL